MKNPTSRITLLLISVIFFQAALLAQPVNDNCANAKLINTDSTCVTGTSRLLGETLTAATNQVYTLTSTCGQLATARDIWYRFVAKTRNPTITVSNPGSGWGGIANVRIQIFAGTCGPTSFTEVACASGATLTPSLTNPLAAGSTYYIRIHKNLTTALGINHTFDICVTDVFARGSRMNEVFSRTILSAANVIDYPWEVTYGRDNFLWITESKGYRVYRMNPNTGVKTTVLDIRQGSVFLPLADRTYNCQFSNGSGAQGGLAGLALHPNFLDGTANEKNYVYISYIYSSDGGSSPSGVFFTNRLVRFTYNTGTGVLESPRLIAALPGSSDHNSQRMIIAPTKIGGPKYLFYASGDMGSGQFGNRTRPQNAQVRTSVEGKILRFNLDTVGGVPWIPTNNPISSTNPVWSIGMRNNQGLAYDTTLNILYGSSHGAYSDDEINIIDSFRNYGHPHVIGYADGNYNGNINPGTNTSVSAGAPWTDNSGASSCPPIGNETTRANAINAAAATTGAYHGPLFSAYATPAATLLNTWQTNPGNAGWYSEGWSGLEIYQNKMIPGWSKSLVAAGLKWGRLIRLPLSSNGTKTLPSNLDSANTADTITYFQSTNRYRDLAFAPNGKDIFLVMDNSSATSGPGVGNPTVPACPGCVLKYSFLGYNDVGGFSAIPKSINVSNGNSGCNTATTVTIDGSNNFLWVPITGPDGNIVAEINAMGQSLGPVTSSYYKNTGSIRVNGGVHYLDRNITITPTITSFVTPVKVRLYISKAEFDLLVADPQGAVGSISQLKVIKNNDACGPSIASATTLLTPTNTILGDLQHGPNGYVLQVNVSGFSSFYFAATNATLPLSLITFTGALENNTTTLLKWKTENETNTSSYVIERSSDGQNFDQIGTVAANGNTTSEANYNYRDLDVANQPSLTVFYRLKMFDKNGVYRYSNVVKVSLPGIQTDMVISPNPAVTDVKATVTSAEECDAEWQIVDVSGRVLLKNFTLLKKGNNELNINMSQLASGYYYLTIKGTCIDLKKSFQKL
ncbi:MAG TPA: PQQ-dependent sugar dehydrogenase [Ferruginibacter sp.]|nr:PQQ-dependent sugar dehydrogenase [Ferruginibacter sp.]